MTNPTTSAPSSPSEPKWWVRDIFVAGIVAILVSLATTLIQAHIDDSRAQREMLAANLAFVRERSSLEKESRPFQNLDLHGQNLSGLPLSGAQFAEADLRGANLQNADLSGGDFYRADLSGADLQGAKLVGVNAPEVKLNGANLAFSDLTNSYLDRTSDFSSGIQVDRINSALSDFSEVCVNSSTKWPRGLTPPSSAPTTCRHFGVGN